MTRKQTSRRRGRPGGREADPASRTPPRRRASPKARLPLAKRLALGAAAHVVFFGLVEG